MKKRKRVVRAGNLVWATICTPPAPNDAEHVRAAKSRATTAARKALNQRAASRRLEMLLAANFTSRDFHLILTYRPSDLPAKRQEAVKRLRKFLAQLRAYRKARGLPLKYVYATEGMHGDKNFHHHLVINATAGDYDLIRSLWIWGDQIDFERIADRDYSGLARYLTKEAAEGKPNGAQSWTPSRGLTKPTVETSWVDGDETLTAPAGCYVIEREDKQNEFAGYSYIHYRVEQPQPRKTRPRRSKDSFTYTADTIRNRRAYAPACEGLKLPKRQF